MAAGSTTWRRTSGRIYAATSLGGVYRSDDNAETWQQIYNDTTTFDPRSLATNAAGHTQPGPVRLEMVDVAGRQVATLVDEWREAGHYQLTWDAAGRPGGVYFSRLSVGDTVRTRSVVLSR